MGDDWLEGLDFEAIETAVKQTALRVAAKAISHRLNADHSDHQGPQKPCACGAVAHYAGRRPKTFTTALGEMELERAWYHSNTATRASVRVTAPLAWNEPRCRPQPCA